MCGSLGRSNLLNTIVLTHQKKISGDEGFYELGDQAEDERDTISLVDLHFRSWV